ncbi:hypothetical protein HK097_006627 [Rhizophlyctis rosea]|uniref:DNA/pantothenate metabolism flavoprotein C-terminal domain-containing protein n=1 Tax=Rhizophlyctis rosea TaxID=64517 RepID=A0AAD5SFR6_9FUNG|nr:hypothetical protein HK097_006627 [Rhizophlyctis rosea]
MATSPTSPKPHHMTWQEFFDSTPPPPGTETAGAKADDFISFHHKNKRRVVLVTSGGTTVPLEANTVRFIDNFSAGTRGATSAEYFVEAGYAVIFLHRQFSLQPYSRHYSHSTNCFLDFLEIGGGNDGDVRVATQYSAHMREVLQKYQKVNKEACHDHIFLRCDDVDDKELIKWNSKQAKRDKLLLMIDFVTLQDYLFLLRRLTTSMSQLGENAMYYLAAAVSDFFIPPNKMVEHKIQSGDGALVIELDQVPKIITPLVQHWAKAGFIISFKLETDSSLLIKKARKALDRYGHQLVVANMLHTRKKVVWFVTHNEELRIELSNEDLARGKEIESEIVPALTIRHDAWIKGQHGEK